MRTTLNRKFNDDLNHYTLEKPTIYSDTPYFSLWDEMPVEAGKDPQAVIWSWCEIVDEEEETYQMFLVMTNGAIESTDVMTSVEVVEWLKGY